MASTIVDIIPKITMTGQYLKLTDRNLYNFNNKINTLLNFIEYTEGNSAMFPRMGGYEKINSIAYNDNIELIMENLTSSCDEYLDFHVSFSYKQDPIDEDKIIVSSELTGLPGSIDFDMNRKEKWVKLVNPRYVKEAGN